LRKADPAIDDRHDHHQRGVEAEESYVSLRKCIIDHQLQQIRIGEPNDAGGSDERPNEDESPLIREEESGSPS
jgi:hypothetical protein